MMTAVHLSGTRHIEEDLVRGRNAEQKMRSEWIVTLHAIIPEELDKVMHKLWSWPNKAIYCDE